MMQHSDLVYVKKVKGKGRGVFARQAIINGQIIEKVPKMLFPVDWIVGGYAHPHLERVFFMHDRKTLAICLGYGSIYNHSYRPNAQYEDGPVSTMIFRAIRDIQPNEEICINYNGDPEDQDPLGFDVVD
jgi:SET domain-containing protein